MRFEETPIPGAFIVELEAHVDERGFFARTFCEREFSAHALPLNFPQCNLSRNHRAGTLRGMHFERPGGSESKLVRCASGAIYDVIVDLRPASARPFAWFGVELSRENGRALFVPPGLAHGFLTLADETDVFYHMGDFYRPERSAGFRWDDPRFAITWPRPPLIMSPRDAAYPDYEPNDTDG